MRRCNPYSSPDYFIADCHRRLRLVGRVKNNLALLIEKRAFVRTRQGTCTSQQELDAEMLLKALYPVADGGLTQTKIFRGSR